MIERRDLYIDGQWVTPASGEVISVDEAATGDIIGTVPSGDATDAERAILAAVPAPIAVVVPRAPARRAAPSLGA